jgi:Trk K+ transport system NAD-binding subunit
VARLDGKRFLITGLSRLTVRVSALLLERGGAVTVVTADEHQDGAAGRERAMLLGRLPEGVEVFVGELEQVAGRVGLSGSACLLALADDDLVNLAAAVTCHALDPNVPIVLRAYDITLADQLEQGLNIRRAYSVSVLSAPSFLAAAVGSQVLESLRLGDTQVPLWELSISPESPAVGLRPDQVAATTGAEILGRTAGGSGAWVSPAAGGPLLEAGQHVVAGGPLDRMVALALSGNPVFPAPGSRRARDRAADRRQRKQVRAERRRAGWIAGGTLLPITALVLVVFLLLTVLVFALTLHKNPIDAFYFAITTALGNSTLDTRGNALKAFGVIAMLAGGALLGVLFSYLASVATAVRIEQRMGRRVQRMSGHAVVAGLGSIGFRIGRLLQESGIPWAGIDRTPDQRHAEAAGAEAPVFSGDVRLPENLERAGIREAACLFACTDSDLANIEACLQAKRLNPSIRTVARIFDDDLANRVGGVFGIDTAVSATHVAAAAFVGAAADERALRPFRVGDVEHVAFRLDLDEPLSAERLTTLRREGILVLACRGAGGKVDPGGAGREIPAGISVIVAGPRAAVDASLLETANRQTSAATTRAAPAVTD